MPPKKTSAPAKRKEPEPDHGDGDGPADGLNDSQAAQLLRFLLSDDALQRFGSPSSDNSKKQPQLNLFDFIHFSREFTPFQILVSALLMSKPISSRLGVRTVHTLFQTDDYKDWEHPKAMLEAGEKGRYDALAKAKTQHKDKTAVQLGDLCQTVLDDFAEDENDVQLKKLQQAASQDPEALNKGITKVNGVGRLAVDVFKRRIQAIWPNLYPFADDRCLHAADYFGLDSQDASHLADHIKRLLPVKSEEEERKQFAFVVDALVAVDLEHRLDDLLDMFSGSKEDDKSKVAKK